MNDSTNRKEHPKSALFGGMAPEQANKALILVHGRGGSAEDILSLAAYFPLEGFAQVAPRASNHSWYPYSFLSPLSANEPWLGAALRMLGELRQDLNAAGIKDENLYLLGFSQGACLALEFAARNATRLGGVVAFTGGLIGDRLSPENYSGNFLGTPFFIGSADPDPHVPVDRVKESSSILRGLNAQVTEKIYPGMGHTIIQDEINEANKRVFNR